MNTRGAKAGRKEEEASTSEDSTLTMMELIKDLSKDVKESKKDGKEIKSSLAQVVKTLEELRSTIETHDTKIKELERAAEVHEAELEDVQQINSLLSRSNDILLKKVVDLEARSRRNNLRIIGLKEGTETGQPSKFFAEFLREVFGEDLLPTVPEIDRAHRSLISKPASGGKSRSVILCLHRFQVKDQLLRESRRRGMLQYRGQTIRIVDDYPAEVMKERSQYKDVMFQLYKAGFKPSLRFPARLRITLPDNSLKWFNSSKAACQFLEETSTTSTA